MIDPNTGKMMTHEQYVKWAIRQRTAQNRAAIGATRDLHGLYTFCCVAATVIVVLVVGAFLLWLVNR